MSENNTNTEQTEELNEQTEVLDEQNLPAETETELDTQETAAEPAAEDEEEDIDPADLKIFGMPRHVFHWTALGAAGGYILAGIIGVIGEQLPGSIFATISAKSNATIWAVVVGAVGYFFSSRAEKKRKAAEEAAKSEDEQ